MGVGTTKLDFKINISNNLLRVDREFHYSRPIGGFIMLAFNSPAINDNGEFIDQGTAPKYYGISGESPCLRELYYGQILKERSLSQKEYVSLNPIGPPDVLHWGKYSGSKSYQLMEDDFNPSAKQSNESKNEDGYIGYYHFVNGIHHTNDLGSIENYIFSNLGIKNVNDEFHWSHNDSSNYYNFGTNKREVIVTFCSYNIFNKSEFKIKYVITPLSSSKKSALMIDKSFAIIPNDPNAKTIHSGSSLSPDSILTPTFWNELNASLIIRLFCQLDDPSLQIPGLVSLSDFIDTKEDILCAISLLVRFLHRGYLTDLDSRYGAVTSCTNNNGPTLKTNVYSNRLVDCLVRLCDLDISGSFTTFAINEIKRRFNNSSDDWNYVILRLLKSPFGENKVNDFIQIIHNHLKNNSLFTTQLGLILIEQVKFLISQNNYENALKVAQKAVQVLPLDFDAWFYFALCHVLKGNYPSALLAINSMPITTNQLIPTIDTVSGLNDNYSNIFMDHITNNMDLINEKTFFRYFPEPVSYINHTLGITNDAEVKTEKKLKSAEGRINRLWNEIFVFNPNCRHPISGNFFYQSPLACKSAKEVSSVDSNVRKLCDHNSLKIKLSAYSGKSSTVSVLDFAKSSPWGRCYDLLSFIVARIGWDEIVRLKESTFVEVENHFDATKSNDYIVSDDTKSGSLAKCEEWLQQMFIIIYEDLKTLVTITSPDRNQNRSALEWSLLGLIGWNAKFNLKITISSLMTSYLGSMYDYDYNYFASVQLLKIYDEFILSDINESNIDTINDEYGKSIFTNKLILKERENLFETFSQSISEEYLTLDFILLLLAKMVSWNLRWYQYVPNHLVIRVLNRLCLLHSLNYILMRLKIVVQQNTKQSLGSKYQWFGWGSPQKNGNKIEEDEKQFEPEDSIVVYMERIINWADRIREGKK